MSKMWLMIFLKFVSFIFVFDFQYFFCRALVEVKPILYVQENLDTVAETPHESPKLHIPTSWGFQHEHWHKSCIQKCIVNGKICAAALSMTNELARNICSCLVGNQIMEEHLELVSKFCIYLLNEVLFDGAFCWEDLKVS